MRKLNKKEAKRWLITTAFSVIVVIGLFVYWASVTKICRIFLQAVQLNQ